MLGKGEIARLAKVQGTHPVHRPGGYLAVKGASVAWMFRNSRQGASHKWIGLGPYPAVSIAKAQEKFEWCHRTIVQGGDPWAALNGAAEAAEPKPTFKTVADAYMDIHKAAWRNANTEGEWQRLLTKYAYPKIGAMACEDITRDHMLAILQPIWTKLTTSAVRLRQYINKVLESSRGKDGGLGDDVRNPADWSRLKHDLARPERLIKTKKQPHAALPYPQAPGVVARLFAEYDSELSAGLLLAAMFTALRARPLRLARWQHIDLHRMIWTIPADHEKSQEPLRVPISTGLARVLQMQRDRWPDAGPGDFVFPGRDLRNIQNRTGMLRLIQRYGFDATQHGLRSTFRDWAGEETDHPADVAEAALSHQFGTTRAAYQRGDLLAKRAKLMQDWSDFLTSASNVTTLATAA